MQNKKCKCENDKLLQMSTVHPNMEQKFVIDTAVFA